MATDQLEVSEKTIDMKEIASVLDRLNSYSKDQQHVIKRLLLGDVITLNFKREKAYINYYVGDNTEEVNWGDSLLLTSLEFITIESGNIETSEDHYMSKYIAKNEHELNSIQGITKFKL